MKSESTVKVPELSELESVPGGPGHQVVITCKGEYGNDLRAGLP